MTIEQVSFRDFIRGNAPADILMLFDMKSKKKKGLFISAEYADEVIEMIQLKEQQKREQKKRAILDFIGEFGESDGELSHKEIKAQKYE